MAHRRFLPLETALVLLGLATFRLSAWAQQPVGLEVGVHGLTLVEDPAWVGGGLYGGYRPGGRARFALTIEAGSFDGRLSARSELLAHFLLNPERRRGAGLYALGGIAGVIGPRDQGYLVLGLGLERAPGAASGWVVEAGVGGGARVAAGWRWRWLAVARNREP